jgi:cytochrome c-type biogenesis protein
VTNGPEILSALALGLLTSVHPCAMATNLAALSWLASSGTDVRRTILGGLSYALGRAFTYTAIGLLLSWLALSHVSVAGTLTHYAELLLGPFLVLAGMFVCGLLRNQHGSVSSRMMTHLKPRLRGAYAGFVLGAVLSLAFCPASASLFFGSVVINLASSKISPIVLPAAYGIGTALPVLIASIVFSRGLAALQTRLRSANWFSHRLPAISGGLLISYGIYLSVRDIIL